MVPNTSFRHSTLSSRPSVSTLSLHSKYIEKPNEHDGRSTATLTSVETCKLQLNFNFTAARQACRRPFPDKPDFPRFRPMPNGIMRPLGRHGYLQCHFDTLLQTCTHRCAIDNFNRFRYSGYKKLNSLFIHVIIIKLKDVVEYM